MEKVKHIRNYRSVNAEMKRYLLKMMNEKLNKRTDESDEEFKKRCDEYKHDIELYGNKWRKRIENADKAGKLREIEATITWTQRAGVYGHQCRAEVWVVYDDPEYGTNSSHVIGPKTSGCGYDKESTALSDALLALDNPGLGSVDRLVIESGNTAWEEHAIGRRPMPNLSFGGKGMSTFTRLFRQLGRKRYKDDKFAFPQYVIDYRQNWDTSDWWIHVVRKDVLGK